MISVLKHSPDELSAYAAFIEENKPKAAVPRLALESRTLCAPFSKKQTLIAFKTSVVVRYERLIRETE